MSTLQQWYDSLAVRAYPPVRKFAKGVAAGAGIPTSGAEAKGLASKVLGTMFGIPEAYDQVGAELGAGVEALQHPIETAKAVGQAARANPPGAAGFAMGAMLPFGRKPVSAGPEALRFGGKALKAAERRAEMRVLRERARVHRELEGPLGPVSAEVDPLSESIADWMAGMRNKHLVAARDKVAPELVPAFDKEIARRGLKRNISDDLQMLHEGISRGPLEVRTAADIGGELLKEPTRGFPIGPSREQAYADLIRKEMTPGGLFATAAPGEYVAMGGKRWMLGKTGPTLAGGKIMAKDFDWVFRKYFDRSPPPYYPSEGGGGLASLDLPNIPPERTHNIERAVEEIVGHGKFTAAQARTIVAKRIRDRAKEGIATPQEQVWFNIHRMKGFGKGGFKWHQ